MKFNTNTSSTISVTPLGIYSFNIGRDAYRNLGFKKVNSISDSVGDVPEIKTFPYLLERARINETDSDANWIEIKDTTSIKDLIKVTNALPENFDCSKGDFWQDDTSILDARYEVRFGNKTVPSQYENFKTFVKNIMSLQTGSGTVVSANHNKLWLSLDTPFFRGYSGDTSNSSYSGNYGLFRGCSKFSVHGITTTIWKGKSIKKGAVWCTPWELLRANPSEYNTVTWAETFTTGSTATNIRFANRSGQLESLFRGTALTQFDVYYILCVLALSNVTISQSANFTFREITPAMFDWSTGNQPNRYMFYG